MKHKNHANWHVNGVGVFEKVLRLYIEGTFIALTIVSA